MNDIQERVQRGIEWLDANVPGWVSRVEVKQFDITSACSCVLGQVFQESAVDVGYPKGFGGYWYVIDSGMDGVIPVMRPVALEPWRYGFDSLSMIEGENADFKLLQEEWEKQIQKRKENGNDDT